MFRNNNKNARQLIVFKTSIINENETCFSLNQIEILYPLACCFLFTLSNAKHGESIVIGLAASSNSKGPQVKTTEPIVKIKVTNCSIQLGWILARVGFAKYYMGSRPEAKKCHFFISCVRMDGWMDESYRFFGPRFFPHHWIDWNEIENRTLV